MERCASRPVVDGPPIYSRDTREKRCKVKGGSHGHSDSASAPDEYHPRFHAEIIGVPDANDFASFCGSRRREPPAS